MAIRTCKHPGQCDDLDCKADDRKYDEIILTPVLRAFALGVFGYLEDPRHYPNVQDDLNDIDSNQ